MRFSDELAEILIECFDKGGKVLIAGNGGSAAEAQHFSSELVGHFELPRKALPAISLTTDTSTITAVGNDDGYDEIFSRQIEALGKKGDVLVLLTTSGASQNCLAAEVVARKKDILVIYFPLRGESSTAACQEKHLRLIHETCRIIDHHYAD